MRVVAVSDLHGWLPDVPPCDLLLIAGDVCPDVPGSGLRARLRQAAAGQAAWLAERFVPWIERAGAADVVVCWGNHDYVGEMPSLVPWMPVHVLTDEARTIRGVRVYATPWTHLAPDVWAFDVPLLRLDAHMHRIPADVDVLVTHGPPYGVRDRVAGGHRAGSRALAEAVARVRPRLHVFGHIHEGRGREGTSCNVAVLDERYEPYRLPVTAIDLEV